MKFTLTKPCAHCPFRTDIKPFLHPGRVRQILFDIINLDSTFICHKTIDYSDCDDGEEGRETPDSQHCAGALILLEHQERPNQMMRIAERLGLYDRTKLNMNAPVYDDPEVMIKCSEEAWRKGFI